MLYQVEDYVSPQGKHCSKWHCICDCDDKTEVDVVGNLLTTQKVVSCGCYLKSIRGKSRKKYNVYDLSCEYGIGYTSNTNHPFYFDLEDYNKIKDYCWYERADGYISTWIKRKNVRLHILIMESNPCIGEKVDHINHNTYDNRKSNLRICTNAENNHNKGLRCDNTSGYSGVTWNKKLQKWYSKITINGKQIYLGVFTNINDAIKARQNAEIKYFKEYRYKGDNKGETI